MQYILVVDAGTTAFKVAVFDESLQLRVITAREFEILRPAVDHAELDTGAYWASCTDTMREALQNTLTDIRQIVAIAVTGHTDTLFALNADGSPVANAILWSDARAQPQAERIQNRIGLQSIYRTTGQTGASPVHFAARLAWFRENQDSLSNRVKHFLQTQDFLIFRLCGVAAIDHSIACTSLLARLEWPDYWPEMLSLVGTEENKLSRIVPPGRIVGHLQPEVAKTLGLAAGIPVIAGAMDATAANVTIFNIAPESVSDTTGAALVIGVTCDEPIWDPQVRVPCSVHALPGKYLLLPWCETGGAALRWYRDQFFPAVAAGDDSPEQDRYDRITAEAAEAPPGCDGLVLLPHFAGSGCPDFDPAAKACLYGLTMGHRRKHISRAFLESIAFLLKQNLDRLADMGVRLTGITCAGGGSRSPLWCQIKADVTGLPVYVCPLPEATATGAAILASQALGWHSSIVREPERAIFKPNLSLSETYQKAYQRFTWLNIRLQPAGH